jgi:ATP-dependent RNA helicase RhlE
LFEYRKFFMSNLEVVNEGVGFDELALSPFLIKTVAEAGYLRPTPIQARCIPLVLEGKDVIGLAQTGTGKTAAFVLPLVQRLSAVSAAKKRGVRALVLAPTRELAEQIRSVVALLAPRSGLRCATVYGGVSHQRQIQELRQHPEIVVACPGRLLDHMRGRTIDLKQVEFLVLDEADRMLDMGFLPDIKKIISEIPVERQTMLFSATMPTEIESLSRQVLRDPSVVRVNLQAPVAAVSHAQYQVQPASKLDTLVAWMKENPNALAVVFTKMKHTAKKLDERLSKNGFDATSLHGNLSQAQRQRALDGFRRGDFQVLIATDIAARGIDVEAVTHVLNYDMPDTLDAYIHRTGRAGRASRTGQAISFVTREDRGMVRSVERWLGAPLPALAALVAGGGVAPVEQESADDDAVGEDRARGRRARGAGRPERRTTERAAGARGRRDRSEGSAHKGGAFKGGSRSVDEVEVSGVTPREMKEIKEMMERSGDDGGRGQSGRGHFKKRQGGQGRESSAGFRERGGDRGRMGRRDGGSERPGEERMSGARFADAEGSRRGPDSGRGRDGRSMNASGQPRFDGRGGRQRNRFESGRPGGRDAGRSDRPVGQRGQRGRSEQGASEPNGNRDGAALQTSFVPNIYSEESGRGGVGRHSGARFNRGQGRSQDRSPRGQGRSNGRGRGAQPGRGSGQRQGRRNAY